MEKQQRKCEWCGENFDVPNTTRGKIQRFCNPSCSAKWRMRQPEHIAKVHTPEVAAKRGEKRKEWFKSGSPKAEAERERIRNLNPMNDLSVREKVSQILRAMGHKPSVRGGNGKGLTIPQSLLLEALGKDWIPEYAISLGKRTIGYPTCYKVDIANIERKIAIEIDGFTHHSRHEQDIKKDAKLESLGWTVIRFWNKEVLSWYEAKDKTETRICQTLAVYNISLGETNADECN